MNEHTITMNEDSLLEVFVIFTKLFHKPYTKEALLAGLPIHGNQNYFPRENQNPFFLV